ncbi:hypothetical protein Avbf_09655, partial [Armadillidium vulgare]
TIVVPPHLQKPRAATVIMISSQSIQLNKSYSINSSNIDRSLFRRGFSLSNKAFSVLFCPSEQLSGKVLSKSASVSSEKTMLKISTPTESPKILLFFTSKKLKPNKYL